MAFKREDRYVVLKIKDLHEYLPQPLIDHLCSIALEVAAGRRMAGREPLECVVVESDWPEYEPTWQAIEKRMTKVPNACVVGPAESRSHTNAVFGGNVTTKKGNDMSLEAWGDEDWNDGPELAGGLVG